MRLGDELEKGVEGERKRGGSVIVCLCGLLDFDLKKQKKKKQKKTKRFFARNASGRTSMQTGPFVKTNKIPWCEPAAAAAKQRHCHSHSP